VPELPEVETIVRTLEPGIRGRVVAGTELLFKPLLRRAGPEALDALAGRRVLGARRRGKMAVIELEGGLALVFHLKMTGRLVLASRDEPIDKHTRLILRFREGRNELRFVDVRKFGFLACVEGAGADSCPEIAALGPEPLEITLADFARAIEGRKGRIKSLLLDQRFIAGIGNIYADEILFDARIHPLTRALFLNKEDVGRLWNSIRRILTRALKAKGSTLRDYVDAEGRAGSFQRLHRVYDRAGEPCSRCGRPIERIVVGGRGTHFCPRCQPRPRRKASSPPN
jgi:formamidopyrimidine-DNA glycosylase